MLGKEAVLSALREFAASVTESAGRVGTGEPEAQLRHPFVSFMEAVSDVVGPRVDATPETQLPNGLGKPDFAIHASGTLVGYVELKAPGKGANPNLYTGHDGRQWKRFQAIPNLIYTDGSNWGLYRSGERQGRIVHLSGDVTRDGRGAAEEQDARRLLSLLTDFLSWTPIIPTDRRGKLVLKDFTRMLADLCRLLRWSYCAPRRRGNCRCRSLHSSKLMPAL